MQSLVLLRQNLTNNYPKSEKQLTPAIECGEHTNFGSREITKGKIRFHPGKPLEKLIKATLQLGFLRIIARNS